MVAPVFPKSTLAWTDRVDQISNVLAIDPNSLAAEVISIENTLGAMPQVENTPLVGNPVTYSTVSSRISDGLLGNQRPYSSLSASNFSVYNRQGSGTKYGQYNTFSVLYDPFKFYNGSDITIQTNGVYLVDQTQTWASYTQGWIASYIQVAQDVVKGDRFRWDFQSSGIGSYQSGRFAQTGAHWMGILHKGDRVRVVSENETTLNPYPIINSFLKIFLLRATPPNQFG